MSPGNLGPSALDVLLLVEFKFCKQRNSVLKIFFDIDISIQTPTNKKQHMHTHTHPARVCCKPICESHLQFYFRHCSTWYPYSSGQAAQESPRYGWRNPASARLTALSPCQLDDHEHSEVIITQM